LSEVPDRRSRIAASLCEYFDPVHCEVVDESHLHAGHAGARSGGGHFCVVVVSDHFEGKSLVERQRLVFGALSDEMSPDTIHALSMKTLTPGEWRG
jgi:BolA protein